MSEWASAGSQIVGPLCIEYRVLRTGLSQIPGVNGSSGVTVDFAFRCRGQLVILS